MNSSSEPSVRYGTTPEPETPYQRAAQVWDERIGSARVQARNWRLMAFGSLILSAGFACGAGLAVGARHGRAVGRAGRQARRGPGGRARRSPTIVRPIRRSPGISRASSSRSARIPADPVIVRQNWLRAYDFTTDRGAAALNDYARANDPFAKVGKQPDRRRGLERHPRLADSFRVAWIERRYENGQLAATERWTAILTIVDAAAARRRAAAQEPARHLRQRHQLVEGARAMKPPFHKADAPALATAILASDVRIPGLLSAPPRSAAARTSPSAGDHL